MAKECIKNCWRIQEAIDSQDTRKAFSGPMAIHPDYIMGDSPTETILNVAEASYDCDGPGIKEIDVVKGFFKKKSAKETVQTCGLPNERFEDK